MFYGFVITERGNNILAHMTAGQQLVMTRVVMDKGTAESAEIVRSMTEPVDAGPAGAGNSAEKNFQLQYAYYKAGNSKVKNKHYETGTAAYHWCRSVNSSNSAFCRVGTNGSAGSNSPNGSWGVAPSFAA